MCSGRAWIVATSVGAVEAMKDQGLCRRNYSIKAIRNIHGTKNCAGSIGQAKDLASPSSETMPTKVSEEKAKQSEESLKTIMYLSCWVPITDPRQARVAVEGTQTSQKHIFSTMHD